MREEDGKNVPFPTYLKERRDITSSFDHSNKKLFSYSNSSNRVKISQVESYSLKFLEMHFYPLTPLEQQRCHKTWPDEASANRIKVKAKLNSVFKAH
jgi:hypothetical protein